MTTTPLDPLAGSLALQALNAFDSPALILTGRVVTMDKDDTVIDNGAVYIRNGKIAAVQERSAPAPDGFGNATKVDTKGTIYPGLLDLHNHLVYNVIAPWQLPRRYDNRTEWQREKSYREQVTGPVSALAGFPPTIPALVRYVETKALLGGTTSVQGMRSTFATTTKFYSGVVRNFEATGDPNLPTAGTRIPDIDFKKEEEIEKFRNTVTASAKRNAAFFYHLCEGIDEKTRALYTSMTEHDLLQPCIAAIHCLALDEKDLDSLTKAGCKIVWSPLSNSLLYGQTINPKRLHGRPFTLGCDWSPSGGKNLLEEMKAAWLLIQDADAGITARSLVAAVTRNSAEAVGWSKSLGTIEKDKYADLLVISGKGGDPYEHLIEATEPDVHLVVIAGYARYGDPKLMEALPNASNKLEDITVGGKKKKLDLFDPDSKLDLTFDDARARLESAMGNLTAIANAMQDMVTAGATGFETLMLDNEDTATSPFDALMAFDAMSALPQSVPLDAPTVVDDDIHFDRIEGVGHLPAPLKKLRAMY